MAFTDMEWVKEAKKIGFSEAGPIDRSTLKPMQMVRDACEEDKCHAYGHNWTCPPECGSLEECGKRMQSYNRGLIVQTVGVLKKTIDSRTIIETEKNHIHMFQELSERMRAAGEKILPLGAGGCRICRKCAYPDPCRFPEKACSSMEAYGLFVTQVCRDNQVPYYHGEGTITYTGCILYNPVN
ncbi:MAG: DUF2284 domain-containing protein [Eubacterium sp.]|jgi:predicted metal-binding protein|nr:DUF2284 domain-containing protein [Eubacterium sp.]